MTASIVIVLAQGLLNASSRLSAMNFQKRTQTLIKKHK